MTFAPGAGRGAAQKKQVARDRRLRTTAALKAFEAKDDDGEAAYNAAMLKANGIGGPKDPIAAVQLLRKAAFLDVVKAQVALGHLYRQGSSSVARNDDEAFRWYEKAALIRRDPEALYQLGKYHRDGTPARAADVTKARECFEAAAAIGGRDAYAEALAALEADLDRQAVIDSVVQSVKSVVGTPSKNDSGGLYETLVDDETVSPFSTARAARATTPSRRRARGPRTRATWSACRRRPRAGGAAARTARRSGGRRRRRCCTWAGRTCCTRTGWCKLSFFTAEAEAPLRAAVRCSPARLCP